MANNQMAVASGTAEVDATSAMRSFSLVPPPTAAEDVCIEITESENDFSDQNDEGHGGDVGNSYSKSALKNSKQLKRHIFFPCVNSPKSEVEKKQARSNSLKKEKGTNRDQHEDFWKQSVARNTYNKRSDKEKFIFKVGTEKMGVGEGSNIPKFVSIGIHNRRHGLQKLRIGESCKRRFYENLKRNEEIETKLKSEIPGLKDTVKTYYLPCKSEKTDDQLKNSKGRDDEENVNEEKETKLKSEILNMKEEVKDYSKAEMTGDQLKNSKGKDDEDKNVNEEMGDDELLKSLFNDACFVLAYSGNAHPKLFSSKERDHYDRNIPTDDVLHDICLMENQLPFIVIETVYNAIVRKKRKSSYLRTKMVRFLIKELLDYYPTALKVGGPETKDFEHFVHYYHMYFTPSILPKDKDKCSLPITHQRGTGAPFQWLKATDLESVGIILKSKNREEGAQSLLDITFKRGVLEIPTLTVDRQTRVLFQNILAFESLLVSDDPSNPYNSYFTVYIKFIAELMTSSADITMLIKKNVICIRFLREREVLNYFNDLKKKIKFLGWNNTYLANTIDNLEVFYEDRFKKIKSTEKINLRVKKIFDGVNLIIIGFVGGLIILICTIIQTAYSMKGKR